MISSDRFSSVIPGLIKSSGNCSKEELQRPRWRVAVRRCLEFSRAQRWRAEPLLGFRTIRPSFARPSRERRSDRAETQQRSEEHTSELQSHHDLVCRLLLEKKKNKKVA